MTLKYINIVTVILHVLTRYLFEDLCFEAKRVRVGLLLGIFDERFLLCLDLDFDNILSITKSVYIALIMFEPMSAQ